MAGLFSDPEDLSEKERFYKRAASERDDITAGMLGWRGLFTDWEEKTSYGKEGEDLGMMSFDRTMNEYQKESNITNAYIDRYGLPKTEADLDKFTETLRTYGANTMADRIVSSRMQNAMSDIFSDIRGGGGKPKTSSLATLSETAGNVGQIMESMQTRAQESDDFGWSKDEFRTEDRPQVEKALNILTQIPGISPLEQQRLLDSAVQRTPGWLGTGLFEDLQFNYDTFLQNLNKSGYGAGSVTNTKGTSALFEAPKEKPKLKAFDVESVYGP